MFVGRLDEIARLETHLLQTRAGQPSNFITTGERGIGKSSLLLYLKGLAEGAIPLGDSRLRFLVIDTDIDQHTTQLGLLSKIELGLTRELSTTEPARKFLADAWAFLKRIEAGGLKLGDGQEQKLPETVLEEFSYSFADVCKRLTTDSDDKSIFDANYDGVLLLIDEADNASEGLALGSFFKLLIERLQRRACDHFMVGLAGLGGLRNVLMTSHPSSLRLFDEVTLGRLTPSEVSTVINICLRKANEQNQTPTSVSDKARALLISFSEGYPHFIQQFGFSAFAADSDGMIDENDVFKGGFTPGGALDLIGDRYYRDNFYSKLQAESYRQVLRIMADHLDEWIAKQDIRKRFRGTDAVLANALKALRDRNIILSKEGKKGVYRLQHKSFAFWIKIWATDPATLEQALRPTPGDA